MNPNRILVPVDFSDCSYGVVREAASLARRLDAGLVLLHVWELPKGLRGDTLIRPEPDGQEVAAADYMDGESRRRMALYLRTHETMGIEASLLSQAGPVSETILATATETDAGMIVMGTHGRTGVSRSLVGSVAEEVVRRATVPVMTIRSQHKPSCEARSCSWCSSGIGPPELQVDAEADG